MKKLFMKNPRLYLIVPVLLAIACLIYKFTTPDNEVSKNGLSISSDSVASNTEYLKDVRVSHDGAMAFEVPLSEIMAREQKYGLLKSQRINKKIEEREGPDRSNLPQNPNSPKTSQYPPSDSRNQNVQTNQTDAPQTAGITFNGSTGGGSSGPFPPDVMGDVGPTQYIVGVNGQFISYNKTTGVADGVINTTPDNFFASVMSSNSGTFTSDPRVRYDRLSKKWYFIIIDVPAGTGAIANRVLVGVSPDSTIKVSTIFKFFFYQHSGTFLDYPTLGIDANALYIGGNLFTFAGAFSNTNALVIRKSSIQGAGPMVTTNLGNLLPSASGAGPYTPQGVDNPDPNATEGYFIGVDNATFGTLQIRRVSTPGGTPTISGNLTLTVSTTASPLVVNHSGNTGGTNGRLDALDDRLFMAQMRNGTLWTTHNVGVNSSGVSTSATRNGARWYQISNLTTTPTLTQSGTVFDNTASVNNYWIPTIASSGQNHAAISFCFAGASSRINMGSVGRLSSDAAGTMQTPLIISTNSSFAYNPSGDPGGSGGRRWGDYSCIRVDPNDDMTFWAINESNPSNNNYGCFVAQLKAPPPATPSSISPSSVPIGSNIAVTLTGTSASGSGFFDPGSTFANHLSVAIDGGVVVNSATYVNATTINLVVTTTGATQNTTRLVTVTNPDGQTSSATIFVVLPVELSSFTSSVNKNDVNLKWSTSNEQNNSGFDIERKLLSDNNWKKIGFVQGRGNSNSQVDYSYNDTKLESGKYNYRLKQIDYNGNFKYYDLNTEVQVGIPSKFVLAQNYPNPFNPSTKIDFDLPENAKVSIKIYDISGKEVANVMNDYKTAGYYSASFNASRLSSGLYFYSISALTDNGKTYSSVKKMMLVK
ncbi:MAG: T9SS type A sorting domain-containing protein [Bacteroidetes bacterium]|nr:T9SS type A sorting domain-containing protein [Bacteroidota bacterium]